MNDKIILWNGFAIVRFSDKVISTINPPNKKRNATRFSFYISPKKSVEVYDHREQSRISSKIYENKRLIKIDVNHRAEVTVKRRADGTEYIVLGDVSEKIKILHALQDTKDTESAEWLSPADQEGARLMIKKFKDI